MREEVIITLLAQVFLFGLASRLLAGVARSLTRSASDSEICKQSINISSLTVAHTNKGRLV